MRTLCRRSLRALVLGLVVAASSLATAPAHAEPFIYPPAEPPIYDPLRPIKERINDTRDAVEDMVPTPVPPSDPIGTVNDMIAAGVTGQCLFQGATIEGAAAGTLPDQTGVVCRVYDERGVMRGGCAMFTPGSAAACAAPTDPVLGPPTVCTELYATYSWGTIREAFCE